MFTNECLDNILTNILVGGSFPLKYRLFKNDIAVDKNTVLADLTESTFEGYAPLDAVVEPDPTVNGSDEAQSLGDELQWPSDADTDPPEQAFGLYVTYDIAGPVTKLFFVELFDAPVTYAFNGDVAKKKVNWYAKNFAP